MYAYSSRHFEESTFVDSYQMRQQRSVQSSIACLQYKEFQTPRISELRVQLEACEKRITQLFFTQTANEKSDAAYNKVLRNDLRTKHINPMSAAGILLLKGMPGIKDQLRLPPTKVADHKLVVAAKRIIDTVRPHAAVFIARKWRPDFIERAEVALAKVEELIAKPDGTVAKRSRATSDLPEVIEEAREIIKSISRLVADDLHDNPAAQRQWKRASRVPDALGRPKYPRAHSIQRFPKPPKEKGAG